ncbi:MAG: RagB/SusD family nutrient uptake outer membrane protein [Parapedobacter sp.]|nr:MAG: RagB/SusD family nutrient uptake outer membrane protein [Parapedobacter sp.]
MKRLFILLVTLQLITSCNKELAEHPYGQLPLDEGLNTIEGLQAAVIGAYQPLKNGYTSGFGTASLNAVLMGADDITTHQASNKQELREMDQFAVNSTNSRMNAIWLGCYQSIRGANNIIENYHLTAGDSTTINQLVGEAHFLRAFSYFWLVRLWGHVPLITTATYDPALLAVQKATPREVYDLIEGDLKKAETLMGNEIKPGRASAGTAKAILAEVYLTEGGYPLNDASKYALAAAKAKEVIDTKSVYGFDLVSDLAALWTGTQASNHTPEDVFALQFCISCGNASALYGKSSMPDPEESGWSDYFAEIGFFNNFPEGKRKDITFHTVFKTSNGDLPWQNSITKHPYYNKFRVNEPTSGYATSSTNLAVKLMRYAQVLLTYAEAEARATGTPSAVAYQAVNQVRNRAGLPDLTPGLSGAAFADSVAQERAWEFAGEYTRWFDLQRLELVEAANANKAADDLKPINTITKERYWLPIPYNDTQINPGL